jgi:hypothetical protein
MVPFTTASHQPAMDVFSAAGSLTSWMGGCSDSVQVPSLIHANSPQTPARTSALALPYHPFNTHEWWVEQHQVPSLALVFFVQLPRRALCEHFASTVLLHRSRGAALLLDDCWSLLIPVLLREHQRFVRDVKNRCARGGYDDALHVLAEQM